MHLLPHPHSLDDREDRIRILDITLSLTESTCGRKDSERLKVTPRNLGVLLNMKGWLSRVIDGIHFASWVSEERHLTLRRVQFKLVEITPRRYTVHRLLYLALSNRLIAVLTPDRHVVRIHADAHPDRDFFSNTINIEDE